MCIGSITKSPKTSFGQCAHSQGAGREVGLSRSWLRGCRAVLFACGCTPYPSLRESVCCHPAAVQDPRVLTPSILVRPSRGAGRLIQGNAGGIRRSNGLVRLALRREGLFFPGRRADATVLHSSFAPRAIIVRLAIRSRALLASGHRPKGGPTRDRQVKGASRTRGCPGPRVRAACLFSAS